MIRRTLVACLWLIIAGTLQAQTEDGHQEEDVVPGLHHGLLFQPRGSLLLATGVWTAVIRFHHKEIQQQADKLRTQFQDITQVLANLHEQQVSHPDPNSPREEEIRKTVFLGNILDMWHREKIWMEAEVEAAEQEILDLRSELRLSRRERALIPFLGDGLKWLFGTSTEKDTERIHKEVKKIDAKVGQLHHIAELQATLIGALSKEQASNQRNIALLAKKTIEIEATIFASQKARNNIRREIDLTQIITSAIRTAGAAVMAFRHEVEKITQAMAHTQQGKVTPTILHPRSLRTLIRDIKQHLPTGWTPAVTLTDTPAEIYNVLDIAAIASRDGWEVHVQIPLKSQTYGDFFLYQVKSIPTHFMNSTIALQTEATTEFFAISNDQRLHIEINQKDIGQCKRTSKKTICQKFSPLIQESRTGCLYNSFRDNRAAADQDCVRRVAHTEPCIYSLSDRQWLYALPHEELFAMQCAGNDEPNKGFRLQGTGVFALPPGCAAMGDRYIVPAHLRGDKKATDFNLDDLTHFKINLNLSALLARLPDTKTLDQTTLKQIAETLPTSSMEEPKLTELKRRIKDLDRTPAEDVDDVSYLSHTSISIGSIGVIGVIVVAILLCRKTSATGSTHVIQATPSVPMPIQTETISPVLLATIQARIETLEQEIRQLKGETARLPGVEKRLQELQKKYEEIAPLL